jgi:hypothetical protein
MGRYILFLYRMGWNEEKNWREEEENEEECIVCNYCVFLGACWLKREKKEQRQKLDRIVP